MRNKVSLCILLVFVLVNSFGQQSRLKKVSLTKIGKEKKKATAQSVLYAELKSTPGSEFRKEKSVVDKQKNNHETYQQYYQGIKVEYGQIKVHKKNGELASYNGNYYDVSAINTNPRISEQTAITIAENFMGYSVFWPGQEELKRAKPEIQLVILPNRKTGEIKLTYALAVGATKPELKMGILYVDATNGSVLKFKNQLFACFEETKESSGNFVERTAFTNAALATGSGYAAYTGSVSFETKLDGSDYVLNDETRAAGSYWNLSTQGLSTKTGIITVDIRNGTDYVNGPLYEFTDSDNNWTPAEMITDDNIYAIDAHWGTEMLYDYWKNEHGWQSYNGSNSAILSIIHYDTNLTNAAWAAVSDTSGFMVYGDGAGSYSPLTTLDVVAHEIAHGINNATSNLDYEYESGALNEGLSDIWAMVFENYANDNLGTSTDPSRINDQNVGGALRSFSNPNAYSQPDTYGGTYWYDTTGCTPSQTGNDYCGVHTNSGVLNYWFWLLYNGGSGTNDIGNAYSVTAISVYDAADIVWQMQTNYLTSTSDYADARTGAIQAATDLFGDCSQQLKSVTNAFHAVGVGDAYVEVLPTITTQPENTTVEANNGTAQFTVVAENYDTIAWEESGDGGDTWFTISDNSSYSGSTTTTLSISNVPETNDLYYRATLSNNCGSVTSNEANLQSFTYTQIPDANFEAALEALGYDDISGDNKVPTFYIESITSLNVSNKSISDITGIEAFVSLQSLNIKNNNLSSIDISKNINLTNLSAQDNSLTALDLSNNTNLQILGIARNSLTSLDVSNNTQLTELYGASNSITSLDLSKNPSLTIIGLNPNALTSLNIKNGNNTAITTFELSGNSELTCILVDDADYSTTNWTSVDSGVIFSDVSCYTEYTLIPDANFEAALEAFGYDDISGDGQVPTELIEGVSSLIISNKNILDLTGIEDFVALVNFYVDGNNLTSLDTSNNTLLKYLFCQNNNLTSLNISSSNSLEIIFCDDNSLTSVDLSNNTALNTISVSNNSLTVLDLTNNTALTELNVNNTSLVDLDLSNNTSLLEIDASNTTLSSLNLQNGNNTAVTDIVLTDNPNLTCVLVDDATYSTTNWIEVDAQISFNNTSCYTEYTLIPDANFEAALEALGYDDISGDGQVPTLLINGITSLNVDSQNISDATGLEDFTALQELYIKNNNLTSIDVSNLSNLTRIWGVNNSLTSLDLSNNPLVEDIRVENNQIATVDFSTLTQLKILQINNNALTTIDLSNNTLLERIRLNNNSITSLNLSNNTAITELLANNNQLAYLNFKNGNNTSVGTFKANKNIDLNCILVDDASYSTTNWTVIDAQTSFSETYCDYTTIPDVNFEAALETLGYDDISGDGQVPTELIENVTFLNISGSSIEDLTGIEGFSRLYTLLAANNNLTTVDVSALTNLTSLSLRATNISSLDVSALTNLEILEVHNNNLTSLDLSNNTALTTLNVRNNSLTSLDVNNLTKLKYLKCRNNSIKTLDFSNVATLRELDCDNNALTSLNLKNGNNGILTTLDATSNPDLTCVVVDDITYSTTNWSAFFDNTVNFNDSYCVYTAIPDANFEAALEALGYDDISGDGQVPTALIENVTSLDINDANITDVTGIEDFTSLVTFKAYGCSIASIDLSSNVLLETLWLGKNPITTLDTSVLPALKDISVLETNLVTLDLSTNTNLTSVEIAFTSALTTLNIKNGNNTNITSFLAEFADALTCVLVDDVEYSETNWTSLPNNANLSTGSNCESCQMNVTAILQGAYDSSTSEMKDDLRANDLLPTTSPYEDGLTCEATLFDVTSSDAIVDWVEIQLRNSSDITDIVERKSFLLKKNGGIIDVDGNSELTMSSGYGDYYVAISHRNHLTVVTKSAITFNGSVVSVDFTSEANVLNGTTALVEVASLVFGLPAGDVNDSGQIQNSGISNTVLQVGISGYSVYDVDMNGQVQNTDITIIQQNVGKGEQF